MRRSKNFLMRILSVFRVDPYSFDKLLVIGQLFQEFIYLLHWS